MNQKFIRYIGLFSLVFAFSMLANANAQIAYAAEDAEIGVNTNSVTEAQQDSASAVVDNPGSVSESTQDSGTGINTNAVSEDTQDGGTGINTNPVTEDQQDGGGNTPDGDNDTPEDNDRPRSRGGSSRTQSRLPVASPLILTAGELDLGPVAVGSCGIYLTEYTKQGGVNNPAEVRKLQLFLKNAEKLDVEVTDVFDAKTFEAVKAFQAKYVVDTMGPWGANIPSGQVYISTTKKINELYCNNPLTFTAEDLAIFAAYRNQKVSESSVVVSTTTDIPAVSTVEDANASTTILNEDGQEIDSTNTAAASLGLRSRIGNFFSGIFNFIFGR